jgi:hypothetical protein
VQYKPNPFSIAKINATVRRDNTSAKGDGLEGSAEDANIRTEITANFALERREVGKERPSRPGGQGNIIEQLNAQARKPTMAAENRKSLAPRQVARNPFSRSFYDSPSSAISRPRGRHPATRPALLQGASPFSAHISRRRKFSPIRDVSLDSSLVVSNDMNAHTFTYVARNTSMLADAFDQQLTEQNSHLDSPETLSLLRSRSKALNSAPASAMISNRLTLNSRRPAANKNLANFASFSSPSRPDMHQRPAFANRSGPFSSPIPPSRAQYLRGKLPFTPRVSSTRAMLGATSKITNDHETAQFDNGKYPSPLLIF